MKKMEILELKEARGGRGLAMTTEELAYLGIEKLKMRFQNKINPEEYFLAYSGGLDSHLLYWFLKEVLHDNSIKIVSVNTYREQTN